MQADWYKRIVSETTRERVRERDALQARGIRYTNGLCATPVATVCRSAPPGAKSSSRRVSASSDLVNSIVAFEPRRHSPPNWPVGAGQRMVETKRQSRPSTQSVERSVVRYDGWRPARGLCHRPRRPENHSRLSHTGYAPPKPRTPVERLPPTPHPPAKMLITLTEGWTPRSVSGPTVAFTPGSTSLESRRE
jgi:hypothetical protein